MVAELEESCNWARSLDKSCRIACRPVLGSVPYSCLEWEWELECDVAAVAAAGRNVAMKCIF